MNSIRFTKAYVDWGKTREASKGFSCSVPKKAILLEGHTLHEKPLRQIRRTARVPRRKFQSNRFNRSLQGGTPGSLRTAENTQRRTWTGGNTRSFGGVLVQCSKKGDSIRRTHTAREIPRREGSDPTQVQPRRLAEVSEAALADLCGPRRHPWTSTKAYVDTRSFGGVLVQCSKKGDSIRRTQSARDPNGSQRASSDQ